MATDCLVGDFYTKFPKDQLNILTSFEYKSSLMGNDVREFNHFIADSGAFTAMASGKKIDDKYIGAYIEWIKEQHIDNYIEMDIDEIVGYEKVKEIRNRLERETGKQSIPVWHLGRGKQGWLDMVKNFDYVALSLSGFTQSSKWLKANDWKPLHSFFQVLRKMTPRFTPWDAQTGPFCASSISTAAIQVPGAWAKGTETVSSLRMEK